ncbi:MAG: hypothetical protein Q7T18_06535 [Sedimentisphaerales bacterium]|nr:hypothetical protein [Sedimentisphaerales bacterium]
MPIPIQNEVAQIVPNAVMIPRIIISCNVIDGKLKTSAEILLSAARCENSGLPNELWVPTGQSKVLYIADVENIDADLALLQPQTLQVFGGVIALIAGMNQIRKVI